MSGQRKQSASRGENRPGSFGRIFNTWERVFVRYDIDDLWCIHHHLDVARQLHQEMAILDEYLVSSKVRMSDTPKFPSLSSPSLILKRFWFWDQDAKDTALYNVQGSISRSWQMSGQCKQSASRGENRPGSFGIIFNTWERVFVIWYRWSIMYPSSPWRGETAWSPNLIFFLNISARFCVHHSFVSQLLKWHVQLSRPLLIERFHGWQLCKDIAQNCLWRRDPFTSATETCSEFWRWRR